MLRSAAIILSMCGVANADASFQGRVVSIVDGDTLGVMQDGKTISVLLDSIEVPDKRLAFGARARKFTKALALNRKVRVLVKRTDPHDRTFGIVVLEDGRVLNEELLAAGMAWVNVRYCREGRYFDLEAEARNRSIGLWADLDPIVRSAVSK